LEAAILPFLLLYLSDFTFLLATRYGGQAQSPGLI